MERCGTETKLTAKKAQRTVQTQTQAEYTETMENTSIAPTTTENTTLDAAKAAAKAAAAELKAAREAERQKLRNQRAIERDAKRVQREIARATAHPHMAKVEKASKNLGEMSEQARALFDSIVGDMSPAQVEILGQHLLAHARAKRTARSTTLSTLQVGAKVTVLGGDPRYHGMEGTVVVSNKLRVRVKVEAKNTPLYLFRADVRPVYSESDAG